MQENDAKEEATALVSKKPSRRRRLLTLLTLSALFWFTGDFIYSQYVQYRIRHWESEIAWTNEGFTPDAMELDRGEGDVALLMVHGFNDTPQIYRKLLPELADQGFHGKAILLPGFGQDVETYAVSQVPQWLEKLRAEVEELSQSHREVWIVAHSLGGAITVNHILKHPDSVDGVVLIAPAIEVSNRRSPLLPTRFWHNLSKYALPSTRITCSPYPMDAKDPAEQERPNRNIFSPRTVVDNTFRLIDENRGRAGEIEIPSLLFLATDDAVVDSPAIKDFYGHLGSTKKQLVELDGSGHLIPVDRDWESVASEIVAFITGPSS